MANTKIHDAIEVGSASSQDQSAQHCCVHGSDYVCMHRLSCQVFGCLAKSWHLKSWIWLTIPKSISLNQFDIFFWYSSFFNKFHVTHTHLLQAMHIASQAFLDGRWRIETEPGKWISWIRMALEMRNALRVQMFLSTVTGKEWAVQQIGKLQRCMAECRTTTNN